MGRGNVPDDLAIENKLVGRAIRSAQSQVEGRNAEIRKNVLKYDDVLSRQREAIYGDRRHILEGDDLHERAQQFLSSVVDEIIDTHTSEGSPDDWDLDAMWTELGTLYPISITIDEVITEAGSRGKASREFLGREILSDAKIAYQSREDTLGDEAMRELERRVVLSVIDRRWRDHLYEMDYLKDGIGLRAMAQRDPLVEYQREGYALFQSMMGQIREESVGFLFNLEVQVQSDGENAVIEAKGLSEEGENAGLEYSAPSIDGEVEVRDQRGRIEAAATALAQRQQAEQEQTQVPEKGSAFGAAATASGQEAATNRAARRQKK
jgi:preprotein translocase subunit SecA